MIDKHMPVIMIIMKDHVYTVSITVCTLLLDVILNAVRNASMR